MLAGAFSCRHLNAHWSDEYIVPGASDGYVTDTACSGRILLVEQQVSLSHLIETKTDRQATFTSHHALLPKAYDDQPACQQTSILVIHNAPPKVSSTCERLRPSSQILAMISWSTGS